MRDYKTGKFDYEVADGYCLTVDCGQAGTEAYALAFLKLFNNAREYRNMIYKIENIGNSDNVYVYCSKKSLETVKEFCNGILPYYNEQTEEITSVGEVKSIDKCKFALIDYDYELLENDLGDSTFDEWIIRK